MTVTTLGGERAQRGGTVTAGVAVVAVPPAVVLGAATAAASVVAAPVVAVAVAAALAAGVWRRAGTVAAALGGRPPGRGDARLVNLVEGLVLVAGVRMPQLRVAESPGLNLAVAGRSPKEAVLVVTSGLLANLDRIALEGALGIGVAALRRTPYPAATLAAATGIGLRRAVDPCRDLDLDEAAAGFTRYPPGVESALRAFESLGTAVAGVDRKASHLWLADPSPVPSAPPPPYRIPIPTRLAAVRDL